MYTATKITDVDLLKKIFPTIHLTPSVRKKIRAIIFLAFQSTAGFRVSKPNLIGVLKKNDIPVPETDVPSTQFIMFTDQQVQSVGGVG